MCTSTHQTHIYVKRINNNNNLNSFTQWQTIVQIPLKINNYKNPFKRCRLICLQKIESLVRTTNVSRGYIYYPVATRTWSYECDFRVYPHEPLFFWSLLKAKVKSKNPTGLNLLISQNTPRFAEQIIIKNSSKRKQYTIKKKNTLLTLTFTFSKKKKKKKKNSNL